MAKQFKTRFIDVNLYQEQFSQTSIRAVKEIYASKNEVAPHLIRKLDFRVCLDFLRKQEFRELRKEFYHISPN